ncbi:MAG: CinA family nicotinamide mononucleotide deamidase-related protein [Chloroflexota bacterium]|nr:CinA family nicotinamide mononucleotide deamidase-related protein [Chloroflexota bacterium]
MKAEIVSIGTEILRGEIMDTNAPYLASQLPLLGIEVTRIVQAGDDQEMLADTFNRAWAHSELIVATGGLGPTTDDVTREALAQMMGEELYVDETLEQNLRNIFSLWGRDMPPHNIKQATLIPSAISIPNYRGTAPGWWVEKGERMAIVMPGPPNEMKPMWENEAIPRLRQGTGALIILARTIKTLGMQEAKLDEIITPVINSGESEIGIYTKSDGIHLRLIARDPLQEEAEKKLGQTEDKLRALVGEYIWGMDEDTLVEVVGKQLQAKGLTLATMESYTGGLLASTLTDSPQSSNYYKGGFVAHSEGASTASGLDPEIISRFGAISPEVAQAMAIVAREKYNSDIGLGIAGSTGSFGMGGTVYMVIDDGQRKRRQEGSYPLYRPEWKNWAAMASLFELNRFLTSHD